MPRYSRCQKATIASKSARRRFHSAMRCISSAAMFGHGNATQRCWILEIEVSYSYLQNKLLLASLGSCALVVSVKTRTITSIRQPSLKTYDARWIRWWAQEDLLILWYRRLLAPITSLTSNRPAPRFISNARRLYTIWFPYAWWLPACFIIQLLRHYAPIFTSLQPLVSIYTMMPRSWYLLLIHDGDIAIAAALHFMRVPKRQAPAIDLHIISCFRVVGLRL